MSAVPAAIPRVPLVGRADELQRLHEAIQRVLSTRQSHAVTVVGGAGIGKARLVRELLLETRMRHPKVRSIAAAAREGDAALAVLGRALRARLGLSANAGAEQAKERLRARVAELFGEGENVEILHFLGRYLGLSLTSSAFAKVIEEDRDELHRVSRAVLRRYFEAEAADAPLLICVEDLQWAERDALELLRYLVRALRESPILFVFTGRPELLARHPRWGLGEREQRIDLLPLRDADAAQMVASLLAPLGEPPEELVDAAVEMSAGSPYLLEQTVRTFLAGGVLVPRPDGSWAADLSKLDEVRLPLTVEDAIRARVAALTTPERELLEMAVTMGSVFWLGALVALGRIEKDAPELWGGAGELADQYRDLLEGLAEREYVIAFDESSVPGETEYAFKHNLEREAIAELLSQEKAERYHYHLAEWLELRLAERNEDRHELLAHHYERGGDARRAGRFYLLAGDQARLRHSNGKAIEAYEQGLRLLGERAVVERIEAYHHYGHVLQLEGRNEEAIVAFRRMLIEAYRLDMKSKGGAAHNRIGRVYRSVGQLEQAMRHLGTGLALFEMADDQRGIASSLDDIGKVHWMRGAYEVAERFMKHALKRRRELGHRESIALSLNNLGLVYQDSGRFEEALVAFGEALAIRREIGDRHGMSQTLNNLGTVHQDAGDQERAMKLWREALEHARAVGDRMREAVILTNLGEAAYLLRVPEEAITVLRQAEELSTALGDRILEAEILRGLAKAHLMAERPEEARNYIDLSVAIFEESKGTPFLGVALRTRAEVVAAGAKDGIDRALAREAFDRSLAIFESLGNELELGKTADAYARFLEQTGVEEDAATAATLRDRARTIQAKLAKSERYDFKGSGEYDEI